MRCLARLVVLALVLFVCLSLALGSMALVGGICRSGASLFKVHYIVPPLWTPHSWQLMVQSMVPLVILACIGLVAWKVLKGNASANRESLDAQESRIMQQLYRGLSRLEGRVESLETLLLDRASKSRVRRKTGLGVGDRRTGEG